MLALAASTLLAWLVASPLSRRRVAPWAGAGLLVAVAAGALLDFFRELVWNYPWLRSYVGEGGGADLWELSVAMSLEQTVILIGMIALLAISVLGFGVSRTPGPRSAFSEAPFAGVLGIVLLVCGVSPFTQALGIFPILFAAYSGRERGYSVGFHALLAVFGVLLGALEGRGGAAEYVVLGRFALCLGLIGMSQGRSQENPGARGMLSYLMPIAGALALVAQSSGSFNQAGLEELLSGIAVGGLLLAYGGGFFARGTFWLNDLVPFGLVAGIASGRLFAPTLLAIFSLGVIRVLGVAAPPVSGLEVARRRVGWGMFFLAHFMVLGGVGSALHGNVVMLIEQADVNRLLPLFLGGYLLLLLGSARAAARIYRSAKGGAPTWLQSTWLGVIALSQLAVFWSGRWVGGLEDAQPWKFSWSGALAPWSSLEEPNPWLWGVPAIALTVFILAYFWTLKKETAQESRRSTSGALLRLKLMDRAEGLLAGLERLGDGALGLVERSAVGARGTLGRGVHWVQARESSGTALMLWVFCMLCLAWVLRRSI